MTDYDPVLARLRERFEAGEITVEEFEARLADELRRPDPRDPTKAKPRDVPWNYVLYYVLCIAAVAAVLVGIVFFATARVADVDPSVSGTCRAHGGVERVDRVIVDGSGHTIVCRDGYSRTFSGGVSP